jgi:hypothetical protein
MMAEPRVFVPGIERSSWSFPSSSSVSVDTFHQRGKHDQRTHGRRGTAVAGGIPITGFSAGDRLAVEEALKTAIGPLTKVDVKGVKKVSQRVINRGTESDGDTTILGRFDRDTQQIEVSSAVDSGAAMFDYFVSNINVRNHKPNYHAPIGDHDPLTATLTHEVGHAAFESLDYSQQDVLLDRLSSALGTRKIQFPSDSLISYGWANASAFNEKISGYAARNTLEAVAEGWTEYRLADRPRLPAKAIGQTMEEFLS